MTLGKTNKSRSGKAKAKRTSPFIRKEWYALRAPAMFTEREFGQTLVTKTIGKRLASDGLKGRVYEVNLADLVSGCDQDYRKVRLVCQEVDDKVCLTNFYGMDMTTDKSKSLLRKHVTLIEGYCDVTTAEKFILRVFFLGFTRRSKTQRSKTSYAQHSQVKLIRAAMAGVIMEELQGKALKDILAKLTGKGIEKKLLEAGSRVYPLQNVFIRKVKTVQSPRYDAALLHDMHAEASKPVASE